MSLHRFFLENQIVEDIADNAFPLSLSDDDLKHAKVLRLKQREHIAVIDSASNYFECVIVDFQEDGQPVVSVAQKLKAHEPSFSITLAQALSKADKFEMVLRHATEVGVNSFLPFECSRSIVTIAQSKQAAKLKRWHEILKSAAKQSGQTSIPDISEVASFANLVSSSKDFDYVLICWEEAEVSSTVRAVLSNITLKDQTSFLIVVGPEGGLSEDEVNKLLQANSNSHLVSLGHTILRTETAGIVAPAIVINELNEIERQKEPKLSEPIRARF